jgi:predicted nucleotidyltransferase
MDIFFEPHRKMLRLLHDFDVDFMLVGGFAVNFYGFNRPTGDMDIWLKPENQNKEKLLKALTAYGFNSESIIYVKSLDFNDTLVFTCGELPFRIDFLTKISGVNYSEAEPQAVKTTMENINIQIIHIHHLVLSKISNNRTKDKLDVEELQRIINKNHPN